MFPIHSRTNNHWSLIIVDVIAKRIELYDSFIIILTKTEKELLFSNIEAYYNREKRAREGYRGRFISLTHCEVCMKQQQNNYDCGVYVLGIMQRVASRSMYFETSKLSQWIDSISKDIEKQFRKDIRTNIERNAIS